MSRFFRGMWDALHFIDPLSLPAQPARMRRQAINLLPFPAGTCLELKLEAGDTLLISARLVTCDPQFGNGIEFLRMLPEGRPELERFLHRATGHEVPARTKPEKVRQEFIPNGSSFQAERAPGLTRNLN